MAVRGPWLAAHILVNRDIIERSTDDEEKTPAEETVSRRIPGVGVPLAVRRTHQDGFDDVMDDFIEQAIEAQGAFFGGGGQGERFGGVIEVGRVTDPIEARVQHVRAWLDARADVASYVVGPLVDSRHGPFDDLDTIEERLPGG